MNTTDKNARIAALKARMQADSPRTFDGKKDREAFWQTPMEDTVVRLLQCPGDEMPIIPYFNHAFKEQEWFIEDCPMTVDLPCPVCEASADRDDHKRKQYFVASVFIPDSGAILWWKFGESVFDVIAAAEKGDQDPFDPIHGANLLVAKPNYGDSRFLTTSPLGTEDEIAKILARCRPLSTVLKLKTYIDLKAKYERVAGPPRSTVKTGR